MFCIVSIERYLYSKEMKDRKTMQNYKYNEDIPFTLINSLFKKRQIKFGINVCLRPTFYPFLTNY